MSLTRFCFALVLTVFGAASAAAFAEAGKVLKDHYGVYGLAWLKTPPEARSILAPKLKFLEEVAAEAAAYHTIDQRYEGDFGGLKTAEIFLRFYKGEFFYMMVTLATTDAGSAAKVFEEVRERMEKTYGPGKGYRPPVHFASKKAFLDHLSYDEEQQKGLKFLYNDVKEQDEQTTWLFKDLQIRMKHWDPFVGWKFKNQVVIQSFVYPQYFEGKEQAVLKPIWIFCKQDVFDKWKKEIRVSSIVPPRDF